MRVSYNYKGNSFSGKTASLHIVIWFCTIGLSMKLIWIDVDLHLIGAEVKIFWKNQVSTIAANGMAPYIIRTSATMVLNCRINRPCLPWGRTFSNKIALYSKCNMAFNTIKILNLNESMRRNKPKITYWPSLRFFYLCMHEIGAGVCMCACAQVFCCLLWRSSDGCRW